MSAYAIAHLRPTEEPGEDVFTYIERIQATLDPFDGHFLVHGGQLEELEGSWPGYVVVIAFPDRAAVRDWYESAAYQEILPYILPLVGRERFGRRHPVDEHQMAYVIAQLEPESRTYLSGRSGEGDG
ncbi:DUF1330 domain-containing protein [Streptomyces sp. NPDC086554]|uniref:DUF1330 domain-containing protein n=1 Tax=Streptomyces sp. NPDC086554 TaxID=3154864 RepID=UPI00344AE627